MLSFNTPMGKQQQGVTLIEVMIVIAILTIVMAIGAPSFQVFIQNAKVRTAAENMQAGLALARGEALHRNEAVSLWLVNNTTAACARSSAGSSWVVSLTDPAGSCANEISETVVPRIIQTRSGNDGSDRVNVSAMSGASPAVATSCVTFNGFGKALDTCVDGNPRVARITFASATSTGNLNLEVRIDAGGSTRLCDPAKTGPAGC